MIRKFDKITYCEMFIDKFEIRGKYSIDKCETWRKQKSAKMFCPFLDCLSIISKSEMLTKWGKHVT